MAETNIKTAVDDIDKFLTGLSEKAKDIVSRQKAAAEDDLNELQALYDTIPEGRLRTFVEASNVKLILDNARERVNRTTGDLDRLAGGPKAPVI